MNVKCGTYRGFMIVKNKKFIRHGFGTMFYDIDLKYNNLYKRRIETTYVGQWHYGIMKGKGKFDTATTIISLKILRVHVPGEGLKGSISKNTFKYEPFAKKHQVNYEGNFNDNQFNGEGILLTNFNKNTIDD